MKIPIFFFPLFFTASNISFSQNIAINTDGTTAESGTVLDVKGTSSFSVTAQQNIFQIKSNDASTDALKLRFGLQTHATTSSRCASLDVPEYSGGSIAAYRHLALQPSGGNVGIGTSSPGYKLDVAGTINTSAGGVYSNGCVRFGTHTLNSHTNGWLYVGDENGTPYAGRGIAMSNSYVATAFYYPNGTQGAGKVLTSDASGLASWSNSPYAAGSGNMVLLYTDETDQTGTGAAPTNPIKSYVVAANTYSKILVEAEVGVDATATGNWQFDLLYAGTVKESSQFKWNITTFGSFGTVKYSEAMTAGGTVQVNSVKSSVTTLTWYVRSFRVYGVY